MGQYNSRKTLFVMIVLLVGLLGALGPLGKGWIGPRGASAEDEQPILVEDPDPTVFTVPPGEEATPLPDDAAGEPEPILVIDPAEAFDTSTTDAPAVTAPAEGLAGTQAAVSSTTSATTQPAPTTTAAPLTTTTQVPTTSEVTATSAAETTQPEVTSSTAPMSSTLAAPSSTAPPQEPDQIAAGATGSASASGFSPLLLTILGLVVTSGAWFVWHKRKRAVSDGY